MRTVVLGIGIAALALWTFVAWIGHAVLEALGGFGAANADILPVPPEWVVLVSEMLGWATDFSAAIVIAIWSIGALVIVTGTAVGAFLAGRFGRGRDVRVPFRR